MSLQKNQTSSAVDSMCKGCKVFYGSQAFGGMCSACNKKQINKQQPKDKVKIESVKDQIKTQASPVINIKDPEVKVQSLDLEPKQQEVKVDRKRCYQCKKKVGLLGIECRCGFIYCNSHRLPEQHKCNFNHHEAAKKKLQKEIIKVYNGKITEI